MKKIMFFLVISLLITSCQPSEADIQKAIAETQTAQPTSTYTPIPPTSTFTPSPIPPTVTPTFTLTPTPQIILRDLAITVEDFANFSEFYSSPIIQDFETGPAGFTQAIMASYLPTTATGISVGTIILVLQQYENVESAQKQYDKMKNEITAFDISTYQDKYTQNIIVGERNSSGDLYSETAYNNYVIGIVIEKTSTMTAEEKIPLALLLLNNQISRLKRISN